MVDFKTKMVLAFKSFMFDPIGLFLLATLVALFIWAMQSYEIKTVHDLFRCIGNWLNRLKTAIFNLDVIFAVIFVFLFLAACRFFTFL